MTVFALDALVADAAATFSIELDGSINLAEDLALEDAVFGSETQALVAALPCHLTAISTGPPWVSPWRLPQATLHHLSRLEGA